uniref:Uncharacterized protein n=1 Tax=viral metagenome TaxID=1070528 RepID=A0A6H1ZF29_9ZZZZ
MEKREYIRHYKTTFIACPYCGYEDHDSWEVDFGGIEGTIENLECGDCGKSFRVSKYCEITYTTEKEQSDD